MSRDRLDKLLHEKLNRIEVEPPKDMWAKLDGELEAMRSVVEQQDTPVEPAPIPHRGITIRRPKSTRLAWRYVAASLAFGTLFGVTLYKSSNIEKHHDQISYIELVPSYDSLLEQDPLPSSMKTVPEELLAIVGDTKPQVKGKKQPKKIEQETEHSGWESAIVPTQREGGEVEVDQQLEVESQSLMAVIKAEEMGPTAEDKGERGGLNITQEQIEREQKIKEWAKKRPRGEIITPLAFSLFTGNTTGKRVDIEAAPGMMLANSGFSIDENIVLSKGMPHETMFVQSLNAQSLKHKFPISFGVSVSFKIAKRWAVQTGVTYTYMQSEADIPSSNPKNSFDYLIKQKLHYLGIPLTFKYSIVESRKVYFYTAFGGALERSVSAQRKYYTLSNNAVSDAYNDKLKVRGLQASVMANIGLEVRVDPRFGFYVEPGLAYYFENSHQPASYRTENPLNFKLDIGLRLHF